VCKANDIGNPSDVASRLGGDEKDTLGIIDSMGRPRHVTVVNEAGLYEVMRASQKPFAKRFWHWVNHEVLPSIRKTGNYTAPGAQPQQPSVNYAELAKIMSDTVGAAIAPVLEGISQVMTVFVKGQAPSVRDNVVRLNPALYEGLLYNLRKIPRDKCWPQTKAAERIADQMQILHSRFSHDRLKKFLVEDGIVPGGFIEKLWEGEKIFVPVCDPQCHDWFAFTAHDVNEREKWAWCLTDLGMTELEKLAPHIKVWVETFETMKRR